MKNKKLILIGLIVGIVLIGILINGGYLSSDRYHSKKISKKLDNSLPQTYNVSYNESSGRRAGRSNSVNYSIRNGKMVFLQSTRESWGAGLYCRQQNDVDGIVYCECNMTVNGGDYNSTPCRDQDIIPDQVDEIPNMIRWLRKDSVNWTNIIHENGCYSVSMRRLQGGYARHVDYKICFVDNRLVHVSSYASSLDGTYKSEYSITY